MKSFCTRILSLGLAACAAAWGQAQQQQPPPEERQAPPGSASRPRIQQPPPPPPRLPDVRQPGETGWYFGVTGWFPTQKPIFDKGKGAAFEEASRVQMQGKPKVGLGAEVGIAIGLHNTLHFSYFEAKAAGNIEKVPTLLHLWDKDYDPADQTGYLATTYKLQHGRISMEYLTWPYPVESRRFRLKTLWGLQYTSMRTVFDAPKGPLADDFGNPLLDASGNLISYAGIGSRWFISPEFGVGATYYKGRHFRWEASASGWAWPRRNSVWDVDTSANFRYGHWELRVGAQGYGFKTNTQSDFFMHGKMGSAFVGVRWYSQ